MAQGINGHVDLAALLALIAVIAGAWPALARGWQRAPIEDDSTGLSVPALSLTQACSKVVHDRLEAAGRKPTLGLLIDGLPGRQVMRQQPPGCTRPYQPAQTIEDLTQIVLALGCIRLHQG